MLMMGSWSASLMRVLLMMLLLTTGTLAGCLAQEGPVDDGLVAQGDGFTYTTDGSHPAYNFPNRNSVFQGEVPAYWTQAPAYGQIPDLPSGLEERAFTGAESAAGVSWFGALVFGGAYSGNGMLWVIDARDVNNPRILGTSETPVRDADPLAFPNGELYLVTATGGSQFYVTDVTDPTNPEIVGQTTTVNPNHNIAVVPGTPIVYNTASAANEEAIQPVGSTDIWDLTDPANPQLVQDFANGYSCHDITFHITSDVQRAYCAGRRVTQIWDIEDPLAPVVIQEIPFPTLGLPIGGVSPATFSHLAMPNHDGTLLIVGDETGGGAAPACDVYTDATGTTVSGPLGNLWFYDISEESSPVLLGHLSPPATEMAGSCTAHFGGLVGDTNFLTMSFYSAGVYLVDFRDPGNPTFAARYAPLGASYWDAQTMGRYVITGSGGAGVHLLEVL